MGYHQRTKHHPHRFAASLGYLDWESQPDPFRRYKDAPLISLPLSPAVTEDLSAALYDDLFTPDVLPVQPLNAERLSSFLYNSLALSAWKSASGNRWPLRVNPSSGNLHPTEGWLAMPAVHGLTESPAILHYTPREHGLEQRLLLDEDTWHTLIRGLPPGAFLVALSSIPWRESWKYGERAYRYCQHDVGHALAALRIAAAQQGWKLTMLPTSDKLLNNLLGLDRNDGFLPEEPEHADLLAAVFPASTPFPAEAVGSWQVDEAAIESSLRVATWSGRPNALSSDHQPWEIVEVAGSVCEQTKAPRDWWQHKAPARLDPTAGPLPPLHDLAPPSPSAPSSSALASHTIRGRRSAVAMDGHTELALADFHRMLARTVPALCPIPWDAWPHKPAVHLGLFVHRVTGLTPGLYALVRDKSSQDALRTSMHDSFRWERPEGTPDALGLYMLTAADARRPSSSISCNQDIAGDGAFSLGMLAAFDKTLQDRGAPGYRELFWETGMIGQVLYLEAEASGLRATGIGCFFDDSVHGAFGIADTSWQSLYHFTVGGPEEDERITTLPAYPAPRD
jgi:SagB-type dehydrogenase family enzyme